MQQDMGNSRRPTPASGESADRPPRLKGEMSEHSENPNEEGKGRALELKIRRLAEWITRYVPYPDADHPERSR